MTGAMLQTAASRNKRQLTIVFGLTCLYLVVEVIGGLWTRSLALLADAGHMLTDVAGVGLALLAIRFAERPATPERTYGYYRMEILAALANAVVLLLVSFYILYEAYQRFRNPPTVESGWMLAVAGVGLIVNLVSIRLLHSGSQESLNMKGAYFEVLSDLLTSIGVIVAGIIMLLTGWYYADPIISAGIGLFIVPRTWRLLKEAVGILLEGTPSDVSIPAIRDSVLKLPGVADIHDVHVWALTSGVNAMSLHVELSQGYGHDDVLERVREQVTTQFKIEHVTAQIESKPCGRHELHL